MKDACVLKKDIPVIISLHNHYLDLQEIRKELIELGFESIFSIYEFLNQFPDFQLKNNYWYLKDYKYDITFISSFFKDIESLNNIDKIVNFRTTGIIDTAPKPNLEKVSLINIINSFGSKLNVLDGGAFRGEFLNFLLNSGFRVNQYTAFEPDIKNFKFLQQSEFKNISTQFINKGIFNENIDLKFDNLGNTSSKRSEDTLEVASFVKLDTFNFKVKINLIKLDIEGDELHALEGAKKLIKINKPILVISTYHKPEHLSDILLFIYNLKLDYKFKLEITEFSTFGVDLYCY
ncbi:FkbM family methyltransferase [Acidimicrobiia bacterium]|jgi:FkbM family methyltransferase|nr:FkbM family methyltransferase [Acidimicrobiia bacterium]